MKAFFGLVSLFCLLPTTLGHMHMVRPEPLNHANNPYSDPSTALSPERYNHWLKKDGSDYPCRGFLSLLSTKKGQAVDTWTAGSKQTFELDGTGPHWGGSCQASLSYDQGKTFRVIRSYEGGCPRRTKKEDQTFEFVVPDDAPAAPGVLFAWSWNNREQEMYMNCAVVNITSSVPAPENRSVVFADRPLVFRANIGNGCTTPWSQWDLKFPDPGPDVLKGDNRMPIAPPVGENCNFGSKGQGYGEVQDAAPALRPESKSNRMSSRYSTTFRLPPMLSSTLTEDIARSPSQLATQTRTSVQTRATASGFRTVTRPSPEEIFISGTPVFEVHSLTFTITTAFTNTVGASPPIM